MILAGTALASQPAFGAETHNHSDHHRSHRSTALLAGSCLDPNVNLSVEESRLTYTLPKDSNPAALQSKPFSVQMIRGAGFQHFGPSFVGKLCHNVHTARQAKHFVKRRGSRLWRMAVNRAQGHGRVKGSLPRTDDRPLYWARLQDTAALRQWKPDFSLPLGKRLKLITIFDKSSRGMFDIDFPAGKHVTRVIMSGFDPYTLDGGKNGTAPGAAGNNIRHGNPSGVAALALDGKRWHAPNGKTEAMETYMLTVNYTEFREGYQEDTVGPFMRPGPRQVDASITMSQAGDSVFHLEQWNGRYHGVSPGNDNSQPCPYVDDEPQLAVNNYGCDISVVNRWGGPSAFDLHNPPQWTTTTLPIAKMIKAKTGKDVTRPPGDGWPDKSVAFGVVWHTSYTEFPKCTSKKTVTRNTPVPVTYPPPTPPTRPDAGSCARSGGGGAYLSNESAYRNTLLRDRMGVDIPAGHIHTPDMQHFETPYKPSDSTFNAWRVAILKQGSELVRAVADKAAEGTH